MERTGGEPDVVQHDKKSREYVFSVRKEIVQQEKLFEEDLQRGFIENNHQWGSEQMRLASTA